MFVIVACIFVMFVTNTTGLSSCPSPSAQQLAWPCWSPPARVA